MLNHQYKFSEFLANLGGNSKTDLDDLFLAEVVDKNMLSLVLTEQQTVIIRMDVDTDRTNLPALLQRVMDYFYDRNDEFLDIHIKFA